MGGNGLNWGRLRLSGDTVRQRGGESRTAVGYLEPFRSGTAVGQVRDRSVRDHLGGYLPHSLVEEDTEVNKSLPLRQHASPNYT